MLTWQDQMTQLAKSQKTVQAVAILKEQFTKGNVASSQNLQVLLDNCVYNNDLDSVSQTLEIIIKGGQEFPKIKFREGLDSLIRSGQDNIALSLAEKILISPINSLDEKLVSFLIEKLNSQNNLMQIQEIIQKIIKNKQTNDQFWKEIITSFIRKKQIQITSQLIIQAYQLNMNIQQEEFLFECATQNEIQLAINTILKCEQILGSSINALWDYLAKSIARCGKISPEQINNFLKIVFEKNIQVQEIKYIFNVLHEQNQEELIMNYLNQYKPNLDSLIIQNIFEKLVQKKQFAYAFQLYQLIISNQIGENLWQQIQLNAQDLKIFIHFLLTSANISLKSSKDNIQLKDQSVQTSNEILQVQQPNQKSTEVEESKQEKQSEDEEEEESGEEESDEEEDSDEDYEVISN